MGAAAAVVRTQEPRLTWLAPPLLGRPTGSSVTINMVNENAIDARVDVGLDPASLVPGLSVTDAVAGAVIEDTLGGLASDTRYYYRILYRPAGDSLGGDWQVYHADSSDVGLGIYSFHTARDSANGFTFTIDSDSHNAGRSAWPQGPQLYAQMLWNVAEDNPDFHISIGDHIMPGNYAGADTTYAKMYEGSQGVRYQMRPLTVPFLLALGNHEDESGWLGISDSLACRGAQVRLNLWPNPQAGDFYGGDTTQTACVGRRENTWAFDWGPALFVSLDPYWYTTTNPNGVGVKDAWLWTLGEDQYNWLYETLHGSDQPWKFLFVHQLIGGYESDIAAYGRGGIQWAKFAVDSNPSFEWGGEDSTGADVFAAQRPGWSHGPIHDMLVAEGVDIVFKGHDHYYVYETLDGVTYQTTPSCGCIGACYAGGFIVYDTSPGVKVNNAGHLRVTVNPDSVIVAYIRAVRAADEPLVEGADSVYNQTVSRTYTVYAE